MTITGRNIALLGVLFPLMAFLPQTGGSGTGLKTPVFRNAITYENQYLLTFSISDNSVSSVAVYKPWDTVMVVGMASRGDRGQVVEALEKLPPSGFIVGEVCAIEYPFHQKPESTTTWFGRRAGKSVQELFRQDSSTAAIRRILNTEVPYARIQLYGWVPELFPVGGQKSNGCTGNSVATTVHLSPGRNIVYVDYRGTGNVVLGADSVGLFYSTVSGAGTPPDGYITEAFHRSSGEVACKSCHADPAASSGALKCSSCHDGLAVQNHVHGPVAAGDCSSCHYDEPDSGYAVRFARSEESQTCLNCHDVIDKDLKAKPVVHKPVQKGMCVPCHSPHGSAFAKQLRRGVNDQCFSCHGEKREGDHPVVFHPVGDRPDSHSPGNDLTCLSCHASHASENIDLMLVSGGYFAVCQTCHQK